MRDGRLVAVLEAVNAIAAQMARPKGRWSVGFGAGHGREAMLLIRRQGLLALLPEPVGVGVRILERGEVGIMVRATTKEAKEVPLPIAVRSQPTMRRIKQVRWHLVRSHLLEVGNLRGIRIRRY
jgi:hypothetical protein